MDGQLNPVELNLDTDKLALEWATYTVQHLQEHLNGMLSTHASRALTQSIHAEMQRNGGHIEKVITKFLQYGRFYDMGVGRGVPIGSAGTKAFSAARNNDGTLKKYRRKPKKWFSKSYFSDVQRFKELYIKAFNKQIPVQLSDAFNVTVNLAA